MKRTLLASAVCLGFALASPGPAHALFGVGDLVFDPTAVEQAVSQLRQLEQQYAVMQNQYRQLVSTYEAIAHTNSVQGLASDLSRLSSTMPGTGQLQGLVRGAGSVGSAAGILQSNRVFAPTGSDFSAQEMTRRAQAAANVQAVAYQQMEASQQRITGIEQLLGQIDVQPDTQSSAALGNRIAAEHTFLAAQQQQLAQLQVLQRAQEQVNDVRAVEKGRQDAEAYGQSTEWAWGAGQ